MREKCYKVFVRPILEYSSNVWDTETKCSNEKIERIQRRACRFVCGDYDRQHSVTSMLRKLNWEPLTYRRKAQKLITLFKSQQGFTTIPVNSLKSHGRKENSYTLPYSRINSHKTSFFHSTIRLWNTLPENIRATENETVFRTFVKSNSASLFDQY